ncbi:Hypothetical protein A7982_08157 [Minicystis rosea]|nr:Hypothetical protein A7982_08157 [Minicystis rosea]
MRIVMTCAALTGVLGALSGCADLSTGGGEQTPTSDDGEQTPTTQLELRRSRHHRAALPVAPDATRFMWQGVQTAFLDGTGQPCDAQIAIGVGDQAVCYAAANGDLRCAGRIYTHDFGPAFTKVDGIDKVEQILVSATFNSEDHNAVCVRTKNGKASCMGNGNDWGQFGTGATGPSAGFVQFGQLNDVVAIATGTWDQLCALTKNHGAHCAGRLFAATPVSVASSGSRLWVDTLGAAQVDEPSVFRVANVRSSAQVVADGGRFTFPVSPILFGQPGDVVDVTGNDQYTAPGVMPGTSRYCWLDGAGAAWCAVSGGLGFPPDPAMPPPVTTTQIFTAHNVLALAGNAYSSTLCAVYDDGSIACNGDNSAGQLGLVSPSYVDTETVVQPPGTIDLHCH